MSDMSGATYAGDVETDSVPFEMDANTGIAYFHELHKNVALLFFLFKSAISSSSTLHVFVKLITMMECNGGVYKKKYLLKFMFLISQYLNEFRESKLRAWFDTQFNYIAYFIHLYCTFGVLIKSDIARLTSAVYSHDKIVFCGKIIRALNSNWLIT